MEKLSEEQEALIFKLKEKISFLDELIQDRQKELELLTKEVHRVDDYSQGSRDAVQKIEAHIVTQKKDILELRAKQQLNLDAFNFIDGLLNATLAMVKKLNLENEKFSLTKKVEHASKNAEIVKLNSKKVGYASKIDEIIVPLPIPPLPPQAYAQEISVEIKKKNRKFRPDKDPNTKAGRASLDLAERRKKAKKKAQEKSGSDAESSQQAD